MNQELNKIEDEDELRKRIKKNYESLKNMSATGAYDVLRLHGLIIVDSIEILRLQTDRLRDSLERLYTSSENLYNLTRCLTILTVIIVVLTFIIIIDVILRYVRN